MAHHNRVSEWWYGLTIRRRTEILKSHGANPKDATNTFSKLRDYSKRSVTNEFNDYNNEG